MHKRGTSGLFTKEKKNTNMSNSIKNSAPQPHSPQPPNKRKKKPLNEMDFIIGKAAIIYLVFWQSTEASIFF
jgi:hypothetical protein